MTTRRFFALVLLCPVVSTAFLPLWFWNVGLAVNMQSGFAICVAPLILLFAAWRYLSAGGLGRLACVPVPLVVGLLCERIYYWNAAFVRQQLNLRRLPVIVDSFLFIFSMLFLAAGTAALLIKGIIRIIHIRKAGLYAYPEHH